MKKRFDTEKPGAFLNLYQPIGADCFGVKSLEPDYDLSDYEYVPEVIYEYVSIADMIREVNKFILEHTKPKETDGFLPDGECREG